MRTASERPSDPRGPGRVGDPRWRPIVDSVDLTVRDGEFVGLLGANGAGKSTVLRTICRIHRPHAGKVSVDGADV
ncbi:MAG: ATP-binding cassette domain-containing protein, partial [Actinomycetota bacterium]